MNSFALLVVLGCASYLIVFGILAVFQPSLVGRFLMKFASSSTLHYLELLIRVVVGTAFVLAAPVIAGSVPIAVFGWIILGTTAVLLFIPWHLHRRFAVRAVPIALRFLPGMAVVSVVGGCLLLAAVVLGQLGL